MQRLLKATPSRRTPSSLTRLPLTAAIYLAFGSLAWAQDAPNPPPPPASRTASQEAPDQVDKATRTLDTITVTSQKRVENLQKVPISVQVLGEQKLKQQDVLDFKDYAKLIPSLSYGTTGGGVFKTLDGGASWQDSLFRNTGSAFVDVTPAVIRKQQADHGVQWADVDGEWDAARDAMWAKIETPGAGRISSTPSSAAFTASSVHLVVSW